VGERPISRGGGILEFQESLLELLRVQVSGWGDFLNQLFDGLDGRFRMVVTLAVIWRRVADSDAPLVQSGAENAIVKLGPVVGSETHWDAELDEVVNDCMQNLMRGRIRFCGGPASRCELLAIQTVGRRRQTRAASPTGTDLLNVLEYMRW
jgi:hypothetical protein